MTMVRTIDGLKKKQKRNKDFIFGAFNVCLENVKPIFWEGENLLHIGIEASFWANRIYVMKCLVKMFI